jgi:hypothetical protein
MESMLKNMRKLIFIVGFLFYGAVMVWRFGTARINCCSNSGSTKACKYFKRFNQHANPHLLDVYWQPYFILSVDSH